MNEDGNLAIYNKLNTPVWMSNTGGYTGKNPELHLTDNGCLKIMAAGEAVWVKP